MAKWREHLRGAQQQQQPKDAGDDADNKPRSSADDCYDLPCGMSFIRRWTFFKFVPFCPTFLADAKPDPGSDGDVALDDQVDGGAVVTVGFRRRKAVEGRGRSIVL